MNKLKDLMYINEGHNPYNRQGIKGGMIGGMAFTSGEDEDELGYEDSDDEDQSLDKLLEKKKKYEQEGKEVDVEEEVNMKELEQELFHLNDEITHIQHHYLGTRKRINEADVKYQNLMKDFPTKEKMFNMYVSKYEKDKDNLPEDKKVKLTELIEGLETDMAEVARVKRLKESLERRQDTYIKNGEKLILERSDLENTISHIKYKPKGERQIKEYNKIIDEYKKFNNNLKKLRSDRADLSSEYERLKFTDKSKLNRLELAELLDTVDKKFNKIKEMEEEDRQLMKKIDSIDKKRDKFKADKHTKIKTVKLDPTYTVEYKHRLETELDDLYDQYHDANRMNNTKYLQNIQMNIDKIKRELTQHYNVVFDDTIPNPKPDINPIYDTTLAHLRGKDKGDANEQIFLQNPKILSFVDKDTSPLKLSSDKESYSQDFQDYLTKIKLSNLGIKKLLNSVNIDFIKDGTIWEAKTFHKPSYDPGYNEDEHNYTQAKFKGTKNIWLDNGLTMDFDFDFNAKNQIRNIRYIVYDQSGKRVKTGDLLDPSPKGYYNYFILENNRDAMQYINVSKIYDSFIRPKLNTTSDKINIPNSMFRKFSKRYLRDFDKIK